MLYDMLLLKILNVSERTGMSVVLRSSDVFATQKLVVRTPKDGRDINQKRVLYKTRLFPTYTEVCREKVYTDVQLLNSLFSKGLRKLCCYSVKNAASYSPLVIVLIGKLS